MRFTDGFCLECKNELQIDTTKKTATCPFCGASYDVDEAIKQKDNILSELEKDRKRNDVYNKIKNGMSIKIKDNDHLLLYADKYVRGYIVLIEISSKENKILNTYYFEADNRYYLDLNETLEKLQEYGNIELRIRIKISTEKNKDSKDYTYSYSTYDYSDWIDFGTVSLYRKKSRKQNECSLFSAEPLLNIRIEWIVEGFVILILAVLTTSMIVLLNTTSSDVSNSLSETSESVYETTGPVVYETTSPVSDEENHDKIGIDLNYSTNKKKFVVTNVEYDSPAELAGLKPGDAIISIDDFDIIEKQNLVDVLEKHIHGNPYIFKIIQNGMNKTTKVSVSCDPEVLDHLRKEKNKASASEAETQNQSNNNKIGVSISYLANSSYIITGVEENSPAERAGIKPGDVIVSIDGIKISDSWDFKTVILRHKTGNPYTYIVNRNGEEEKFVVSLD